MCWGICSAAAPFYGNDLADGLIYIQAVTHTVEHNSKRKQKLQLLKKVTGMIAPAQMTALVSLAMPQCETDHCSGFNVNTGEWQAHWHSPYVCNKSPIVTG